MLYLLMRLEQQERFAPSPKGKRYGDFSVEDEVAIETELVGGIETNVQKREPQSGSQGDRSNQLLCRKDKFQYPR